MGRGRPVGKEGGVGDGPRSESGPRWSDVRLLSCEPWWTRFLELVLRGFGQWQERTLFLWSAPGTPSRLLGLHMAVAALARVGDALQHLRTMVLDEGAWNAPQPP